MTPETGFISKKKDKLNKIHLLFYDKEFTKIYPFYISHVSSLKYN